MLRIIAICSILISFICTLSPLFFIWFSLFIFWILSNIFFCIFFFTLIINLKKQWCNYIGQRTYRNKHTYEAALFMNILDRWVASTLPMTQWKCNPVPKRIQQDSVQSLFLLLLFLNATMDAIAYCNHGRIIIIIYFFKPQKALPII